MAMPIVWQCLLSNAGSHGQEASGQSRCHGLEVEEGPSVSPGSTKAEGIDQNLLMVGDSCLDRPAFTMGKSPFHSCASAMEGMVGFYLRHWTHFGASYQAPLRC